MSRERLFLATRTLRVLRLFIFGAPCLSLVVSAAVVVSCSSGTSKRVKYSIYYWAFLNTKTGWLQAPQAARALSEPSVEGQCCLSRATVLSVTSMGNSHSFLVPASRREEVSGYLCLREWKSLSSFYKKVFKKKIEECKGREPIFSMMWNFP